MRDETGSEPSTLVLGSTLLHRTRHLAPWQLAIEPGQAAILVIVRRGACRLRHRSEGNLALAPGDLVLALGADAHLALGDSPRDEAFAGVPSTDHLSASSAPLRVTDLVRIDYTSSTTLVPGLIGLLPPVVHLRAAHGHGAQEVASMVRLVDAEVEHPAPGRDALLGRLVESLFVYAVRAALGGAANTSVPGASGISDGAVARALELLHAHPADRWTVEGLAKATGLSRAAFARRFVAATGIAPLQYVTEWRMRLSERLLIETDDSLAAIAARVGYESEFAFSRAFKRHRQLAPGAFRRAGRASLLRARPGSSPTRAAA